MIVLGTYKGCRIFLYDAEGTALAEDTEVIAHNKEYMTITVRNIHKLTEISSFVTVLILSGDSVHEYQGRLRRVSAGAPTTEIALFKGKLKETRTARRFAINAPAIIENLIVGEGRVPLRAPIPVTLVNLSTTGALLRAKPNSFGIDTRVEFKLVAGTNTTVMNSVVVRIREIDEENSDYGCRLIAVKQAEPSQR